MRNSLALWALAAGLVTAGTATAADVKPYSECTHEPSDTDLTAAKGAFQAGNASFDEADYPRAIIYWEDAYRRDCTAHALLLNLARAYELNGNKPQAVVSLQTYLARVPASPDKDKIQRRIDVLQKQLEAERAAAVQAAQAPPVPPPKAPSTPAAEEPPVSTDSAASVTSGGKRPIAPLIVGAAGAGLAVVGVILFATGKHDLSNAESKCPAHFCANDALEEEGNAARQRVNVGGALTVVGIVTAGVGLSWYLLQKPSAPKPVAFIRRLEPVASPSFVGLSYSSRF
jgi:tetratricopeptide (TPR) repeat protein